MDQLLKILKNLHPEVDFKNTQALIDDGVLDSFDMVTLVMELNDAFDIEIGVEDIIPQNFNSVDAMMVLINTLLAE